MTAAHSVALLSKGTECVLAYFLLKGLKVLQCYNFFFFLLFFIEVVGTEKFL